MSQTLNLRVNSIITDCPLNMTAPTNNITLIIIQMIQGADIPLFLK